METAQASMAGLSIDRQGIPAPSVGLRCLVFLGQWQKRSAFRGARLNQLMAVQRFGSELKDHLLLELTTEFLCRHNQIIPHLSKQYSFHHCPRNTRHLTAPEPALRATRAVRRATGVD